MNCDEFEARLHQDGLTEEELAEFVSVVLADTEEVWSTIFKEEGLVYEEPTLVIYKDQVQSACGTAGSPLKDLPPISPPWM